MRRTPPVGPLVALLVLITAACGESAGTSTAAQPSDTARPTSAGTTAATRTTAPPAPTSVESGSDPSAARSITEPVTASSEPARSSDCRRLTDFEDDNGSWVVVNDGVMGGRSDGAVEFSESEMRFTGDVVTEGGGFTSVRLPLEGTELADSNRIVMRVRADARVYGLTMQDRSSSNRRAVSHRADLTLEPVTDDWTTVSLPYETLEPNVFGRAVDADPFDPDRASEFGIIVADGTDGPFGLAVDWIDACP